MTKELTAETCTHCGTLVLKGYDCAKCYKLNNIKTGLDLGTTKNPLDVQVGGGHYKDFKIQPIEFCQANQLNACETSIVKYVCRHKEKGGRKDLEKAKHYIDLLLELEYKEGISSGTLPPSGAECDGIKSGGITHYVTTTAAHLIRDGSDA